MTTSSSSPQITEVSEVSEVSSVTEISQGSEGSTQSLKFCSSCSREKRLEGGTWIPTSNKKQRWICASCLFNRTHRTGSTKV